MITDQSRRNGQRKPQDQPMVLATVQQRIAEVSSDTLQWQADMRAAVANSIDADDVQAIIEKQVEKAKAGSESAAKFIMQHVIGTQTPVTIKQTNVITDVETAARIARDER